MFTKLFYLKKKSFFKNPLIITLAIARRCTKTINRVMIKIRRYYQIEIRTLGIFRRFVIPMGLTILVWKYLKII